MSNTIGSKVIVNKVFCPTNGKNPVQLIVQKYSNGGIQSYKCNQLNDKGEIVKQYGRSFRSNTEKNPCKIIEQVVLKLSNLVRDSARFYDTTMRAINEALNMK